MGVLLARCGETAARRLKDVFGSSSGVRACSRWTGSPPSRRFRRSPRRPPRPPRTRRRLLPVEGRRLARRPRLEPAGPGCRQAQEPGRRHRSQRPARPGGPSVLSLACSFSAGQKTRDGETIVPLPRLAEKKDRASVIYDGKACPQKTGSVEAVVEFRLDRIARPPSLRAHGDHIGSTARRLQVVAVACRADPHGFE